jgi:hypothetical protein
MHHIGVRALTTRDGHVSSRAPIEQTFASLNCTDRLNHASTLWCKSLSAMGTLTMFVRQPRRQWQLALLPIV